MSSFQSNITPLGVTASFRDWFNQYNNSVLGKINNSLISRPFAGDGVTLSFASDGGYTFALSGSVTNNMTFSGNVIFNGSVQLSNTQLDGLAFGVSGNYASIGVTLGKVVRLTNTGGITLAKADTAANAEVLGIAIDVSATRTIVAVAGKIFGTTLSNNLISGGFTSGCVYFVDPAVAGGVTRTEPFTTGFVSKPMILGLSTTEGLILPYRGQHISGITGGTGNFIFNSAILVDITSKGEVETAFNLRPGTIIATDPVISNYPTDYVGILGSNAYFKASNQTPVEKIMGIVSEYVGAYNPTIGGKITLKVNTNGSVINNVTTLNGWGSLNSGVIYLDSTGTPTQTKTSSPVIVLGNASADSLILNIDSDSGIVLSSSGSGSGKSENILINGSMNLWQRGRGISAAYGLTAGATPTKAYIADRWIMWGASGERGFTAQRKTFTNTQTDVAGYPKYHISLQKNTANPQETSYFYNVIEDPRTVAQKQLTLSFYARTIGGTGSFSIHSRQYSSTSGYIDGVTHSTKSTSIANNWDRYTATFVGPTASSAPISYFLVGVGLRESGKTFEFAQFLLEEGATASIAKIVSPLEDYERASYFYQRSYDPDEITGTNTISENRGLISHVLPNNPTISHQMKYRMAKTPDITIYSLKGKTGEISFKDTSSGISNTWYDSKDTTLFSTRIKSCFAAFGNAPTERSNGNNFLTNPISNIIRTRTDFFFSPYTSYCWFDVVGYHYVADADTIIQ
jgi:hypothetical protein